MQIIMQLTNTRGYFDSQLVENEQRVADLRVQLATVQGNHKESMDQLSDKSRHVVGLKTDLDRSQQQNQAMAEEVWEAF